jgi:Spy/CpxP family protein refolding chaperone
MKRKLNLALAAVFMFSALSLAQIPTSVLNKVKTTDQYKDAKTKVDTDAKSRADKMATDLKLTADQKSKVESVFINQNASIAKLKSEKSVGSEAYKTKLNEINKTCSDQLEKIIGKDKFQKYQSTITNSQQQLKEKANSKVKSLTNDLNIK